MAYILTAQTEPAIEKISLDELLNTALQLYPELQKTYFLKWEINEISTEIQHILAFYEAEKLIQVVEQNITIHQTDDTLRLLKTFAHLYTVNLTT